MAIYGASRMRWALCAIAFCLIMLVVAMAAHYSAVIVVVFATLAAIGVFAVVRGWREEVKMKRQRG